MKKILAISGSLRKNSVNESILRFIAGTYSGELTLHFYDELHKLPHFNPDLENENLPQPVTNLRRLIEESDGVLICTPEYVFSPPGALKNALEWTVPTTVFSDKPVALIVASGLGEKTFESLTLILNTLGAKMSEGSRLLIQGARAKISAQGNLQEETVKKIDAVIASFLETLSNAGGSDKVS